MEKVIWLDEQGYRILICKKQVAVYKQMDDKIFVYHIADKRNMQL